MRRIAIQPRANWRESVQAQGLTFLEVDGWELWDESAYYELGERDVEQLEGATRALVSMCGEAVDLLVREDRLHLVGIPERYREYVKKSWLLGEPSLYGRFDLAYDAKAPPKLLEYNADTPTSLIESAIVQWHWFRDRFPHLDQYNSLHEKLIAAWKRIVPRQGSVVHFACVGESIEDTLTIEYLRDTAQQAGLRAEPIAMSCIGWNAGAGEFRDEQERPVRIVFKLYPWEWLLDEEFSRFIPAAGTTWIEPAWKMILSSKAILAVLHSMFPSSPYLLPASF
ncbi:MAG TPA: glutathionylspermidine synthase family protein, partial [Phycisphaerales bacterium]